MTGIESPADACALHPVGQAGQLVLIHPEAGGYGGYLQQVEQFAQLAALVRQAQQPTDGADHGTAGLGVEVGDVIGDVAGVATPVLAEDGADGRRHDLDVGHHHHAVAGSERLARRAGRRQPGEQLVLQYLQFAHRAVRHLEQDRAVARRQCGHRLGADRLQVQNPPLHPLQQRGLFVFLIGFSSLVEEVEARQVEVPLCRLGIVEGIELPDEVAPLPAPGREQWVGVAVHLGQGHQGQVRTTARWLSPPLRPQQLPAIHDVAPVVAAGIGDGQHHLAVAAECRQRLQGGTGHVAHAEGHHPPCH